jgi:hypothetical protein
MNEWMNELLKRSYEILARQNKAEHKQCRTEMYCFQSYTDMSHQTGYKKEIVALFVTCLISLNWYCSSGLKTF